MSSYRNVFWRGAFALALLPVSAGLVAASGAVPAESKPAWSYEFSTAQEGIAARQLAMTHVQELRAAAAQARATAQATRAGYVLLVRIERERAAQPSG